jgi:hypothetical protein
MRQFKFDLSNFVLILGLAAAGSTIAVLNLAHAQSDASEASAGTCTSPDSQACPAPGAKLDLAANVGAAGFGCCTGPMSQTALVEPKWMRPDPNQVVTPGANPQGDAEKPKKK